jgi:hypothetical protein
MFAICISRSRTRALKAPPLFRLAVWQRVKTASPAEAGKLATTPRRLCLPALALVYNRGRAAFFSEPIFSMSLAKLMNHFRVSHGASITAAVKAAASGSWDRFGKIANDLANSKVVAGITDLLNSSTTALKEFLAKFSKLKLLGGVIATGIGGACLADAAAMAGALGISVLGVQVIAVVLLLWGIYVSFSAIWEIIGDKIKDYAAGLLQGS